ncbi:hypothetical protein K440DRAFT_662162 [Wilcoxina mikolae CBS 423.85]|nr:hypothetical protein K440DRAFT_662162 [Wilcoxina mikolae CBS 423.85]
MPRTKKAARRGRRRGGKSHGAQIPAHPSNATAQGSNSSKLQEQPEASTTSSHGTGEYGSRGEAVQSISSPADTSTSPNARALARATYIPYREDTYDFSELCSFTRTTLWDESKFMNPDLTGVAFGIGFKLRDAHLQTITTIPSLCNALTMISVIDGSILTNAGIKDLITNCPNLKFVSFHHASKLTNVSFDLAITKLSNIELLRIKGQSLFKPGKLKTKGSISILRRPESGAQVARNLKMLDLTNQEGISISVCRKLSREREGLEVVVGYSSMSAYTFWKGEMVKAESYRGFEMFQGGSDNSGEESSEADDDDEEEEDSDLEDEMYDAMLGNELFSGGYLDPATGILMPPNGLYWE